MTHKELATHLSKFHQALESYGQAEGVFSDAHWEKNFSIPLNAFAARIEIYLEYLAHPLWSVLNKMAMLDIEAYKIEAIVHFRKKLTQFMKGANHLPLRTEKLCKQLLSELDQLD